MNEPTGHVCKCGKPAYYSSWGMMEDGELGWIWECISCHFDKEEYDFIGRTCEECGYFWYRATIKDNKETKFLDACCCRKYQGDNFPCMPGTDACPDFVPRATPAAPELDAPNKPPEEGPPDED